MNANVMATIDCLFRQLIPRDAVFAVADYLSWQPGFVGWWLALEPEKEGPQDFAVRICWWLADGRSYSVAAPTAAYPIFVK